MTTDGKKDGAEQIAESCRVGVRMPPFYPEKPALWYAQLEGQFVLANITSDTTKFYYAIAQLEPQYAAEVEDIITTPPNAGRYDKLKAELIKRLSVSREKKVQQLLLHEELGDRKPSHFVRHLQNLAGPGVLEVFIRTIWTSRLPQSTQSIIASQPRASLEELADLADRMHDVVTPNLQVVSASSPASLESSVDAMTRQISELTRQVAELTTRVADCPSIGRLFVTDAKTKTQFLVDTGSDLCVFPRSGIRDSKTKTNYVLCAANGSKINTYGNQRLIDSNTTLYTVALPACPADISSVKVITGESVYHHILREYPDITRPSGTLHAPKHNTVHHIRTTPGPPVSCTPRRLAPDKLKVAKEEFATMFATIYRYLY